MIVFSFLNVRIFSFDTSFKSEASRIRFWQRARGRAIDRRREIVIRAHQTTSLRLIGETSQGMWLNRLRRGG